MKSSLSFSFKEEGKRMATLASIIVAIEKYGESRVEAGSKIDTARFPSCRMLKY